MPSAIPKSLRWTPLLVGGAILLGFLLSGAQGPTMYEGMSVVRIGFICAAAVATTAAVVAMIYWRQLPFATRFAALAPFALVLAFCCYGVTSGAA